MFDGFWSGVFGGLFGRVIVKWAGRFPYWLTFIIVTGAAFISFMIHDVWIFGFDAALVNFMRFEFFVTKGIGSFVLGLMAVAAVCFGLSISNTDDDPQSR
jgi:hypothetical protein